MQSFKSHRTLWVTLPPSHHLIPWSKRLERFLTGFLSWDLKYWLHYTSITTLQKFRAFTNTLTPGSVHSKNYFGLSKSFPNTYAPKCINHLSPHSCLCFLPASASSNAWSIEVPTPWADSIVLKWHHCKYKIKIFWTSLVLNTHWSSAGHMIHHWNMLFPDVAVLMIWRKAAQYTDIMTWHYRYYYEIFATSTLHCSASTSAHDELYIKLSCWHSWGALGFALPITEHGSCSPEPTTTKRKKPKRIGPPDNLLPLLFCTKGSSSSVAGEVIGLSSGQGRLSKQWKRNLNPWVSSRKFLNILGVDMLGTRFTSIIVVKASRSFPTPLRLGLV